MTRRSCPEQAGSPGLTDEPARTAAGETQFFGDCLDRRPPLVRRPLVSLDDPRELIVLDARPAALPDLASTPSAVDTLDAEQPALAVQDGRRAVDLENGLLNRSTGIFRMMSWLTGSPMAALG